MPLVAVAVILALVATAGHFGVFGAFGGSSADSEPPFVMLAFLAFAMGLQNAAVSTTTGLAVRTTHLTGPATDLGIHLGVAWFDVPAERRKALKAAALRAGKMVAFMVGASLALPLTRVAGFLALLLPAAFVLAAAALSFAPEWGPSDFAPEVVHGASRVTPSRPARPVEVDADSSARSQCPT